MMLSAEAMMVAVLTMTLLLTRPRAAERLSAVAGDVPDTATAALAGVLRKAAAQADGEGETQGLAGQSAPGMGLAASIAAVAAASRAGATAYAAFASLGGDGFASQSLSERRIRDVLDRRKSKDETAAQVATVAADCMMAASLSGRLGCSLADCLDVVGRDHRRSCMMRDARRTAFAVPKATVSLLMGLPAATILLGELMGAGPLRFLLSSAQGHVCLALGGFGYVVGAVWMAAMLRAGGDGQSGGRGGRVGRGDCDGHGRADAGAP
ncbi:type II secretion system F family protein [Bifidobacterium leontopitheci]|uniref:Ppilus assembly protein n=1 Tax=Bifidobacterium leontopitheci TaxID=2650774 RepID=A0A6I1GEH9_9BIFI|nr:hypothetical protein [Bifidobacterium leontopitheci]KAB7789945.1 ppilus assembly protein [Bifidobacterium leontopitheci]